MTHRAASLALVACLLGISPVQAQDRMLAPPDSQYFSSRKSWGKDLADQWGTAPDRLRRLAAVGMAAGQGGCPAGHHRDRRQRSRLETTSTSTGIACGAIRRSSRATASTTTRTATSTTSSAGISSITNNLPWDYDGHGTFVAGIIAGDWNEKSGLAGVNPFARLMILRALNDFGNTRASVVAEAIAYAADNGARVINLSLGGKKLTNAERAAIDYAFGKGAVIVVAAGNQGIDISDYGIASSDKVLAVAATGPDDQRAKFSNWGKIAVSAPGTDILSLRARRTDTMLGVDLAKYKPGTNFVGDDKRFYRADGTSFCRAAGERSSPR